MNRPFFVRISLYFFKRLNAIAAYVFSLIDHYIVGVVAENAGGLILAENNGVLVHIYFQGVSLCNVKCAAKLNRQYNASKLIDFSDNSC